MRNKKIDLFVGVAVQESSTHGLGYILTLKRNNINDPVIRAVGVDVSKIIQKILAGVFHTTSHPSKTSDY